MKEGKPYLIDFLQLRLCRQVYDVSQYHDLDHLKQYCLQKGDRAEFIKGMMQWSILCSSEHNDNLPAQILKYALDWFKGIQPFLPGQYTLNAVVSAVKKLLLAFECKVQSFYHLDFEHQRLSASIPSDTSPEGHGQVLLNTTAALTRCGEYSMSVLSDAEHIPVVIGIGDKPWVSDFVFDDPEAASLVQPNLDAAKRLFIEGLWEGLISDEIWPTLLSAITSKTPFFNLSKLPWYPGCHEKVRAIVPQELWATKRTDRALDVRTWHRLLALMAAEKSFFPVKKNNLDKTWRYIGTLRPPEDTFGDDTPKHQHMHVYLHQKKAISILADLLNPDTVQHIYLESGVVETDAAERNKANQLRQKIAVAQTQKPQLVTGTSKTFIQEAVLTDKAIKESA